MKTDKIWGQTEVLLQSSFVELHRLFVLPFSRCSMHTHQYKWNAFIVLSGRLRIEFEDGTGEDLFHGGFLAVGPGKYHRFVSDSVPVVALEFYYPEPLSEDILRKDIGCRYLEA